MLAKQRIGERMKNNHLLPPDRSVVDGNTGQVTGKQTLHTPNKEALQMHIHCNSLAIAREENICINTPTQAIVGGAA